MLFWKNKREVTFNLFKNRGGLVRLNVISTKEFHTYFMEENKLYMWVLAAQYQVLSLYYQNT